MINFEDDLLKKIADNDSVLSYYKYEYERNLREYDFQETKDKICKVIDDIWDIEDKKYYLCKNYKNKEVVKHLIDLNHVIERYIDMIITKNNISEKEFIEIALKLGGSENND
jgi:hypothetical protein